MALMSNIFHHLVCVVCVEDAIKRWQHSRTMWNSSPPSSALADVDVSGRVQCCLPVTSATCLRRHFKSLATGSMQTIVESGHNWAIVTISTELCQTVATFLFALYLRRRFLPWWMRSGWFFPRVVVFSESLITLWIVLECGKHQGLDHFQVLQHWQALIPEISNIINIHISDFFRSTFSRILDTIYIYIYYYILYT